MTCQDLKNNRICITQDELFKIKPYQANHVSFLVRLVEGIFETNSGMYSDRSGVLASNRLQSNYTPGVPWLTSVPGRTS